MGNKTTIQLVDDCELTRIGLLSILAREQHIRVVAESNESVMAINDFSHKSPQVVLMGMNMSGMNSLSIMERMLNRQPDTQVIMISSLGHQAAARAMDAGAKGFLHKKTAATEILRAIRDIRAGKCYIDRETAQHMAMAQLHGEQDPLKALSSREYEVFIQLAKGTDVKVIAEEHFLSPKTVRSHKANIMQKLNLHNTVEFVCFAMKRGFIDCDCETSRTSFPAQPIK